mmetsp:Transcript_11680/g.23594  ORF Transcript_11680/g.23594 Transcript_11680/m.23594 type:complete len:288 (-) Transcript_11680:1149-2012(-)
MKLRYQDQLCLPHPPPSSFSSSEGGGVGGGGVSSSSSSPTSPEPPSRSNSSETEAKEEPGGAITCSLVGCAEAAGSPLLCRFGLLRSSATVGAPVGVTLEDEPAAFASPPAAFLSLLLLPSPSSCRALTALSRPCTVRCTSAKLAVAALSSPRSEALPTFNSSSSLLRLGLAAGGAAGVGAAAGGGVGAVGGAEESRPLPARKTTPVSTTPVDGEDDDGSDEEDGADDVDKDEEGDNLGDRFCRDEADSAGFRFLGGFSSKSFSSSSSPSKRDSVTSSSSVLLLSKL